MLTAAFSLSLGIGGGREIRQSAGILHGRVHIPWCIIGKLSCPAGLINFYGWIFDLAAIVTIPANVAVQMYVVFHPDFVVQVSFGPTFPVGCASRVLAVACLLSLCPHQLVLLSNRDILQSVHACITEMRSVHDRRRGIDHRDRACPLVLEQQP